MSKKRILAIIGICLAAISVICSALYLFASREQILLNIGLLGCCLSAVINAINNIKRD